MAVNHHTPVIDSHHQRITNLVGVLVHLPEHREARVPEGAALEADLLEGLVARESREPGAAAGDEGAGRHVEVAQAGQGGDVGEAVVGDEGLLDAEAPQGRGAAEELRAHVGDLAAAHVKGHQRRELRNRLGQMQQRLRQATTG